MKLHPDERKAADVASLLVDCGVRTVVINACRSAAGSNEASNIASLLVHTGIQAAVGMSFNVLSLSADQFMREFYKYFLGQRTSPISAVSYARQELRNNSTRMSKYHTKVTMEDHLVPIMHCQKSEVRDFQQAASIPSMTSAVVGNYPTTSELFGREGDLLRLEWLLTETEGNHVHLQGSPGLGKTKLLQEATSWWRHTGLFERTIFIQLSDLELRDCTVDKIVASMASQARIDEKAMSTKSLAAALDEPSTLIILDSLDAIDWSLDLARPEHERQFCICLKRFRKSSIVTASRNQDLWLGTAIQSWVIVESLDLSNTIAFATSILRDGGFSSRLSSQDDQSYFEQLMTLSQGNPLAIRIIVYDLAKHLSDDASVTIFSHLLDLVRLRPVFLDEERLASGGGARSIAEILEWIANDINSDSKNQSVAKPGNGVVPLKDYPPAVSSSALGSLSQTIDRINKGQQIFNPMTEDSLPIDKLSNCGFYSATIFLGFWHNLPLNLESFIITFGTLLMARRYLKDEAFNRFRFGLCEFTEEGIQEPRQNYKKLTSKEPFGLSPAVAYCCLYAGTKSFAKFQESRDKSLRHFVQSPVTQTFGKPGHQVRSSGSCINPILSLVAQCTVVRDLYPKSIIEDIEISRDAQYKYRVFYQWGRLAAYHPLSGANEAMKTEFDFDYFNYLSLFISYQQMDSWPDGHNWLVQPFLLVPVLVDLRRMRFVDRIFSVFIKDALKVITVIRQRFTNPGNKLYDHESQDREYQSWNKAIDLEVAVVNTLVRALFCRDLLQKPVTDLLNQWNVIKSRPMFQVWRHTQPELREAVARSIALNSQWFEMIKLQNPLEVKKTNQLLTEVGQLRNQISQFIGLTPANAPNSEPPKEISSQIIENTVDTIGGRDLIHIRAHNVVHSIRPVEGKANIDD